MNNGNEKYNSFYPLSSTQNRLWILYKLEPHSSFYNVSVTRKLVGGLNIKLFHKALEFLVNRHEALRTNILEKNGNPVQVIHKKCKVELQVLDLAGESFEKKQALKKEYIREITKRPFKLESNRLFRFMLIKIKPGEYAFTIVIHHIISDAWSFDIFLRELSELYRAYKNNLPVNLPELSIQYKDYAQWEQSKANQKKLIIQEKYWLEQLSGELPLLDLPLDKRRPSMQTYNGSMEQIVLDKNTSKKLNQLANQANVTLFTVLFSAFNVFLHKLTGQTDIIVGTFIDNRNSQELDNIFGFFVNTLTIRSKLESGETFVETIQKIKNNLFGAYEHPNYPFEQLVEKINPTRNINQSPFFCSVFQLDNIRNEDISDKKDDQICKDLRIENDYQNFDTVKFDFKFKVCKTREGILRVFCEYNTDLFVQSTIKIWLEYFRNLIENILNKPETEIKTLELLSKKEKNEAIRNFNAFNKDNFLGKNVQQKLNASFAQHKNQIAIKNDNSGSIITYLKLDRQSDYIAGEINNRFKKDTHIGIFITNKAELIISMIGILRSRNIFVTFDQSHSDKRIELMIAAVDIKLIITDDYNHDRICKIIEKTNKKIKILLINESFYSNLKKKNKARKQAKYEPDDKIYIYFTSGSTGTPKAIVGKNKSLLHFINWEIKTLNIKNNYSFSQFISPSFDAFLRDVFVPLCCGGIICIPNQDKLTSNVELANWIDKNEINIIHCVPALFRLINNNRLNKNHFKHLRYILLSGEEIYPSELKKWYKVFGERIQLINLYGPSETTMVKTFYFINRGDVDRKAIPIGKPMDKTTVIILDKDGNICGKSIIGELYINTQFDTFGYYNNEEQSAKVFVKNPYFDSQENFIYKTGDLVKMLSDGNIEYVGRADQQVKIRGNRVELGEIENCLNRYFGVKQSVIISKKDKKTDEAYLVAYYAAKSKISSEELRDHLKNYLPEYMIPSYFVWLDKFPLNANGKLDRLALPEPGNNLRSKKYQPPRTELEKKLAGIWQEVLGIEEIGVNDSFFELGGHSLKAIKVISRIKQELSKQIELKQLFQLPTIKELVKILNETRATGQTIIPVKSKSFYALSHTQIRHWIYYKMEPDSSFYNISRVRKMSGKLNMPFFRKAADALVARHEILRANFKEVSGNPVQIIHPMQSSDFKVIDLSRENSKKKRKKEVKIIRQISNQPFKLESDKLARFNLIKTKKDQHTLIMVIHHIISDDWSDSILLKELSELYNSFLENREPNLSALYIQFKDYAEWEQSGKNKKRLKKQEEYWLKKISGELPVLDLPIDKVRPPVLTYNGRDEILRLNPEISKGINEYCCKSDSTLFAFMLTVFTIFLYKLTNQKDIIVGMPVANRDYPELENVIGVLVNNLAIRNKIEDNKNFETLLSQIRQNIIDGIENKNYSIDQLIEKLNPERDTSRSPLFNVVCQAYEKNKEKEIKFNDIIMERQGINSDTTKADVRFYIINKDNQIDFNFNYNTDLFNPETIKCWMNHLAVLTENILNNPQKKISKLELISEKEKRELLNLNNSKPNYPRNKTIHKLFEEQAEKTPNDIAVVFEEEKLTYRELNQKANRLAHYLLKQRIRKEEVIPIILDNCSELVISLLSVLKAGGAFVLVDKDTPGIRREKIIKNTTARTVISDLTFSEKKEEILKQKKTNPELDIQPDNLSNILYTSSTTGEPKGVMLEHRNVVKYAYHAINCLKLKRSSKVCQNSSVSYAIALWHFFAPLLVGAKLFIYPEEIAKNPVALLEKTRKDRIRLLEITPSSANVLLDLIKKSEADWLNEVTLILVGEKIRINLVKKINEMSKGTRLMVHYGQSEVLSPTRFYEIDLLKNNKIMIGKPENGSQIYILDKNKNPVPKGLPGIIYAFGEDLLFRGYLNDSQKTKEMITSHPLIPGKMIYRTGDVGKMHPDGNIEYIGRADQQVQIRGNRVEPGEVENCINQYPEIKQNIVLVKKDKKTDETYLIAYYTAKVKIVGEDLREYLKNVLPAFMLPAYFVQVDQFPVNQNGKLDQDSLPEPDREFRSEKYQLPRTELEKKLAVIWQEVLSIKKIGVNDNFFELGGHSLKAVQLAARMKKFKFNIPLSEIFKYPQISELSKYIEKNNKKSKESSMIGGIPFTAVYDHLNGEKYFSKSKIIFETRFLDINIFKMACFYLAKFYSNLNFYILSTAGEKKEWEKFEYLTEIKMEQILNDKKDNKIANSKGADILLEVIFHGGIYYLNFQRKSSRISKFKFTEVLKNLQKIYNLSILDLSQGEIKKYLNKEKGFPMFGYPEYYGCDYATISELVGQKNNKKFFRSLIPGLNLDSLPSYCIINNLVRKNDDFIAEHLRKRKSFDILGIKYSIEILKNSKQAVSVYKKRTRGNEPLLLIGTAYYLPFAEKAYRSKQFTENCIKEKRVPANWSIFYGFSKKYPIIYSPNIGFFGKIPQSEFMRYWKGTESLPGLSGIKLKRKIPAYQIVNVDDSLIKSHTIDMLYKALRINVDEFYKSKTIEAKEGGINQKIYFGIKAILIFKKEVGDNIKKKRNSIPDIFIVDMLKKMKMSYLFLRDLLQDTAGENNHFVNEFNECKKILKIWDDLNENADRIVKNKKIPYRYNIFLSPDLSLWKMEILSKQEKEEIIKSINDILNIHDKLFSFLDRKLKKFIK